MTRAQALLIVVGNPAVLGLDPLWRAFLNYVYVRGGWAGASGPSWDAAAEVREADSELAALGLEDIDVLARRTESLTLAATAEAGLDEEAPDEVPWRVDE